MAGMIFQWLTVLVIGFACDDEVLAVIKFKINFSQRVLLSKDCDKFC